MPDALFCLLTVPHINWVGICCPRIDQMQLLRAKDIAFKSKCCCCGACGEITIWVLCSYVFIGRSLFVHWQPLLRVAFVSSFFIVQGVIDNFLFPSLLFFSLFLLQSSDTTDEIMIIRGIPNGREVYKKIASAMAAIHGNAKLELDV